MVLQLAEPPLPSSPKFISAANLFSASSRSSALARGAPGLDHAFSDKAMGLALDVLTASVLTGPFLATLLAVIGLVRLTGSAFPKPHPVRRARAGYD